MSIKLIDGLPGSGKSLYCAKLLFDALQTYAQAADQFARKHVENCIELARKNQLGDKAGDYLEGLEIFDAQRPLNGQQLTYRPVYTMNFAWNLTNPQINHFIKTKALRILTGDELTNDPKNFKEIKKGDKGYHFITHLAAGAILLIDECQFYFPNLGKRQELNSTFSQFLSYLSVHRHQGVDLLFVTQDGHRISKAITDLTDEYINVYRPFGWKKSRIKTFNKFGNQNSQQFRKYSQQKETDCPYDKKLYQLYRSSELHTIKAKIPKQIYLLIIIALICLFALYTFLTNITKPMDFNQDGLITDPDTGQKQQENATPIEPQKQRPDLIPPEDYDGYPIPNYKGQALMQAVEIDDQLLTYAPYNVHSMRLLGLARFGNQMNVRISAERTERYQTQKQQTAITAPNTPNPERKILRLDELISMGYDIKLTPTSRHIQVSWGGSRYIPIIMSSEE
jgi:hypothetical protein